jgi:hypothetical protein
VRHYLGVILVFLIMLGITVVWFGGILMKALTGNP